MDTRSSMTIALTPVRCIDCDADVPAGWIDYTDAPKCPATGMSHRVPAAVLAALEGESS